MERKNKLIIFNVILIFLISLATLLFVLFGENLFVLQETEVPAVLVVSNYTAWNITQDGDILDFGVIRKGTNSEKKISIANEYSFPIKFEFNVKGNISDFIDSKVVYLSSKEDKDVVFSTKYVTNESFGKYSGIVRVIVKRAFDRS